ncbi:MAG: hypothetical protein AAB332_03420, partial [Planctomycetota bacterium]
INGVQRRDACNASLHGQQKKVFLEVEPTMHLDFNNMMSDVIGPEHGITEQELKELESLSAKYAKDLKEERARGALPFLELP